MFEKEAEEYCGNLDKSKTRDFIKDAYQDGAEFGYNKANEWHYVKDELPTNTGLYLIFYYNSFFNDKVRCIARYSPDRKEFLNLSIEDGDEVIAWQELPALPKEIERRVNKNDKRRKTKNS